MPMAGVDAAESSDRLRGVALALALPLGAFGAHRFYAGKNGTGFLMLCTLGGMGLWWFYDLILIAAGEFQDAEGRRLSHWSRESGAAGDPAGARKAAVLAQDLEATQAELRELAERVDFLERALTQVRERPRVGQGRGRTDESEAKT